jgi:hypothetical protein
MFVAAVPGHSDDRMVERLYGHLAPSHAADAIRKNLPRLAPMPVKKVQNIRE